MSAAVWIAAAALLLILAVVAVPRILVRRAQDRLAAAATDRAGDTLQLLTRADLVTGRYRRIPGILGLGSGTIAFEGLFGESVAIATSRIQKIVTGKRLASDRRLLRLEVLRFTRVSGEEVEFVMTRAAGLAWRSHLGLWAVRERQADADRVSPGGPSRA